MTDWARLSPEHLAAGPPGLRNETNSHLVMASLRGQRARAATQHSLCAGDREPLLADT